MGSKKSKIQKKKRERSGTTSSLDSSCFQVDEWTIDDLPDLAMISILSNLPFADRISAELVSQRWCRLSRDQRSWQKFRVLKNSDLQLIAKSKPIKENKMDNLISRFAKHIRELHFVGLYYTEKSGRTKYSCLYIEHLQHILPKIPNLLHFWIEQEFAIKNYTYYARYMPQLISLHLSLGISDIELPNDIIDRIDWFPGILDCCDKLEYFHVDYLPDSFADSISLETIRFPASLRYISFGLYVNRSNMEILTKMVIRQCPKLCAFEGRLCGIDEKTAIGLKNLEYLKEFCFCAIESRHSILRFGQWDKMRALNFQWMDFELFSIIAKYCPNIEHLGIEQCYGAIHSKSITYVLEFYNRFPKLGSFMLRDYTAVECFLPLLTKGTLQYIYLTGMLPIDQICKIILANPLLEKLYVDQTFLANEVDEMRSYLQEFLSEKCSPNNLRIICRGYGPNIQKSEHLTTFFPWIQIEKNKTWDPKDMPVYNRIRFLGFSDVPFEL